MAVDSPYTFHLFPGRQKVQLLTQNAAAATFSIFTRRRMHLLACHYSSSAGTTCDVTGIWVLRLYMAVHEHKEGTATDPLHFEFLCLPAKGTCFLLGHPSTRQLHPSPQKKPPNCLLLSLTCRSSRPTACLHVDTHAYIQIYIHWCRRWIQK